MATFETWQRRALFRNKKWTELFIEVLYHYRATAYLLHEFVVMPNHVHLLITQKINLAKAVQFIRGGFSFRIKKELGSNFEIWQKGFSDHRIRGIADYSNHVVYIRENPIQAHLCERPEDYVCSSAHVRLNLDTPSIEREHFEAA